MGNSSSTPSDEAYDPSKDPVDTSDIEGHPFAYENLVLEGGGAKACAYAGAFEILEKVGILQNIKRIAGTSGGAIAATLLALGCSPQEVARRFTPWDELLDASRLTYPWNLWNIFGFNPGTKPFDTISKHIEELTGDPKYTFRQLYEDRGVELCIVASNISVMTIQYFHPKTSPNVPIAEAVRMSMSIPVVMAPYKKTYGLCQDYYVDGGVLCNYPVNVFDGWYLSMHPKDSFFRRLPEGSKSFFCSHNDKTLGICVYETGEVDKMKIIGEIENHQEAVKRPDTKQAR